MLGWPDIRSRGIYILYDQRWIYHESNEALSFNHFSCKGFFPVLIGALTVGSHGCMFLSNSKSKLLSSVVTFFLHSEYLFSNILCIGNFIFFFLNMECGAPPAYELLLLSHSILLPTARPSISSSLSFNLPSPSTLSLWVSAVPCSLLGHISPFWWPSPHRECLPKEDSEYQVKLSSYSLSLPWTSSPPFPQPWRRFSVWENSVSTRNSVCCVLPALPFHFSHTPFSCSSEPFLLPLPTLSTFSSYGLL